jgi:N-acetylmuramoyl-L-alanine amidase
VADRAGGVIPPSDGRRLSPAERRAIRERVRQRSGETGVAHRPVPRMPTPDRETTVRSRGMVALGTLLIIGLTVLAFAGGRLFGSPNAEPEETVAAVVGTPIVSLGQIETQVAGSNPGGEPPEPQTVVPGPGGRVPVVCLDPGHGGADRGFTRGPFGNLAYLEESTLVTEQALELRDRLAARGVEVIMTRETDVAPNPDFADVNGDGKTAADDVPGNKRYETLDDIQARINICNEAKADLLVSIHINGYTTQKPRGYETWYTRERPFGAKSATFATLAYAHLKDQLRMLGYVLPPEEERGVNPDTAANVVMEHSLFKHFIITGPEVPGAVEPSEMPGAIVEALFVSNDGDASILISPEGKRAIINAYEYAILEYFERYPVDAND